MTVSLVTDRIGIASGAAPLEALAAAREQLIEASAALRRRPNVRRVGSGADCRGYRSGSTFEIYVEAELATDQTVTWWVDVTWDRTWRIVGQILRDDDNGQSVLREFAVRVASDPSDFVVNLTEIVDEVVASIERSEAIE
jgi:hypothetical protein